MKHTLEYPLNPAERLQLLQLLELQTWQDRNFRQAGSASEVNEQDSLPMPSRWQLLNGISLRSWQQEAEECWFNSGKRGIAKVVTGAGKTTLALAIAQRLQETDAELRLVIVVPTIVLLNQWREQLLADSNIPEQMIGILGGGNSDDLNEGKRVLICVLSSAARKLPQLVRQASVGQHVFLIVDECHRAGAAEMQKLFDTPRAYVLGLSATPERDDEPDEYDPLAGRERDMLPEISVLEREIGPVIFDLTYAQAIQQGILPPFTIEHYSLSLEPDEAEKYRAISQEITDLRRQLEVGSRRGLALIRWCRSSAGSKDSRARRFISLTTERKQLLYGAEQRFKAVDKLVEAILTQDARSRIIIFHENIAEVMRLFIRLRDRGYPAVAEHSALPDGIRSQAISLFREGVAQIIVSAKSLIEGFNVPSADVGIIVAASSSVRQRIQTLGRLLRHHPDREKSKHARLVVLSAAGTVDEMIYEKADWNTFVGAERNEYFRWKDVGATEPDRVSAAPRAYVPGDAELDESALIVGQEYPGRLDGPVYRVDLSGTISDESGLPIDATSDLLAKLGEFSSGGRFLVTPDRRYMVKLQSRTSGLPATYLGQLTQQPRPASQPTSQPELNLQAGAEYPLHLAAGKTYSVLQRDDRLIALKRGGNVVFVKKAEEIAGDDKRNTLKSIQECLRSTYRSGRLINKIFVNHLGHVGYLYQGQAYFVGLAPEGPAGFMMDE